jgi:hypothetical protein
VNVLQIVKKLARYLSETNFNTILHRPILPYIPKVFSAEMIYPAVVYLMQATLNASLNPIAAHSNIALRIMGEVPSVNFLFCLPFGVLL